LSKTIDCKWLSEKEQNLCWDDGDIRATIGANGDKAAFHLAFSQENLTPTQKTQISSLFCGIIKKDMQVQSWIGTKKALENPEYRDQDGLCQGEFKVHVEVFTEYGHRIRNDFIIKVGDNWRSLNAEILECGSFRKSRFRRVADFFTHRT
jgi:hypothetical protein